MTATLLKRFQCVLWRPSRFGRRKAVWCRLAPVAGLEAVERWWIPEMPPFGCRSVTPRWPGAPVWAQSSWLGVVRVGLCLYFNQPLNKSCWKNVQEVFLLPGALIPACCTAPEGVGGICFWLSLTEAWWSFPFQAWRRNLLRGSGLCRRKEDPNEAVQSLREDVFLHKKLGQTVLKVGAWISAKENQTIGGED